MTQVQNDNTPYKRFVVTAAASVPNSATGTFNFFVDTDNSAKLKGSTGTVTSFGGSNTFGTIAVSGQSDVVADSSTDTLTLAAGSGVTLTTNAGTDTVTIAASTAALAFGIVKRTSGDYTVAAGGAFVDVDTTNVAVTITTGAHRCRLVMQATGGNGSNGGSTDFDFTVDGTRVGETIGLLIHSTPTATNNQNVSMSFITDVLTAASHTFRVQWKADTGTGTLRANTTTTPLVFWVEELNLST